MQFARQAVLQLSSQALRRIYHFVKHFFFNANLISNPRLMGTLVLYQRYIQSIFCPSYGIIAEGPKKPGGHIYSAAPQANVSMHL